jgi:xylulokinase
LTLGTNFVLRAVTGERLTSRSFAYPILPGRWAWVNNVPKASAQLDIVAEALCTGQREAQELHRELGALAEQVAPGSNDFKIERMRAGGQITEHARLLREHVGMAQAAGHGKGVIYRAMMEAIGAGVLDLLKDSRHDGATHQRFFAAGGGVHHCHLLRLLAAMLDAPLEVAEAEAGLIGAGMAAAVGSGWYASLVEAMEAMTSPGSIIEPDPVNARLYHDLRQE